MLGKAKIIGAFLMIMVFCVSGSLNAATSTTLENGEPVNELSAGQGEWLKYSIDIPAGASNLSMKISSGSGDADLYTRFGSEPTTSSYDCRPYLSGNNEECSVGSPQAGTYYVSIMAYDAFSGVTLLAEYEGAGGDVVVLTNGQPVENISGSTGSWKYFKIVVPANSSNLTITTSGGTGDADLYTRFNAEPTLNDYDCRPYESGNNETCTVGSPSVGDYFIGIQAYSSYSGVTVKASYSGDTPPPGDDNYIVTAVNDNLDQNDALLMRSGLQSLGYAETKWDSDVSTSELEGYLGQNITTIYHTGHGSPGSIATSNGTLYVNSNITINAVNTIIATCLTLKDTTVKEAFSSSAMTMSGYTNYSYDFTDDTVVNNFIGALGNGNSYPLAWYNANKNISSLNDRWRVYSREGGTIVTYSAGGLYPSLLMSEGVVTLDTLGKVNVTSELLNRKQMRLEGRSSYGLHALTSEDIMNIEDLDALQPTRMSRNEALARANAYLSDNSEMSAGTKLEKVYAVTKKVGPEAAVQTVGWVVRYVKTAPDGLSIRGNTNEANKTIMLTGEGSAAIFSKNWSESYTMEAARQDVELLAPGDALVMNAEIISESLKGDRITFNSVELAYGKRNQAGDKLVPAYAFGTLDGSLLVIDAQTGDLMK